MRKNVIFVFLFFAVAFLVSGCNKDESISVEEQFELDQKVIEKYLADNNLDAIKHPSGLYYEILEEGTGAIPTDISKIKVSYTVYDLPSDVILEQTDEIEFFLNQLYLGWRIGVPLISEGGSIILYLPREYANREKIMWFHIELIKVD